MSMFVCVFKITDVDASRIGKSKSSVCNHISLLRISLFKPIRIPLNIPEWPTAAYVLASHSFHKLGGPTG